jgi:hypothetical protein
MVLTMGPQAAPNPELAAPSAALMEPTAASNGPRRGRVESRSIGVLGVAAFVMAGCGNPQFASEPIADAGAPPPMPVVFDAGPPPPPPPCDPVQSSALSAALQSRQGQEAPGMKAEGATVCAVVSEGQSIVSPSFILEPGYCYTFLGEGLPPVAEVDMYLQLDASGGMVLPPPLNALSQQPLMVDTLQGLQAGMGMKNTCYQWAFPIPGQVKLHVKSTKGGPGPVAAQVFRKKK